VTLPGPSAPPPQVGGGVFEVDIAQAPTAIRQLQQALEELKSIRRDAVALGQIHPPTRDQVSLDAASALARAAIGGPSSFVQALDHGITELDGMVRSLEAGFEAYRRQDEESARAWARTH
jgi:hypothetical protein